MNAPPPVAAETPPQPNIVCADDSTPIPPPPAAAVTPSQPVAWIGKADVLIALIVVVLAGFCAAYVARNSDQWLHFAAGRDLLSGKYSLGSDPYSYLAADRVWVNHSWLHDLSVYGLYSLDDSGQVVVAFKAILFALTIAVAILIRPRGAVAWPWWLLAVIAVIAAAPHTHLRPTIGSGLFVAITLFILLRLPWRTGSYRNPLLLAGLCALWANLDQWFLLGPVMVLLVLMAEVIQKKFMRETVTDTPPIRELAMALGLCLVATLFNPHHVRVWTLPIELGIGLPESIGGDSQLNVLRMSPLSEAYRDSTFYGKSINGGAFLALFIIGSGLLALGLARVRLAYMVLWVLFAFLALLQFRLIFFFAIAAIPLAATPLSDLASRFNVEPQSRGLQLASSLARLFAVPLSLLLLLCAWPGWLHPLPGDRAYANRVALGVEADPGLARAARHMEGERKYGTSLEGLNGFALTPELANHIAWFAPHERVAVNGRFRHHAPDLEAWITARKTVNSDRPGDLPEAMKGLKADYVILNSNRLAGEVELGKVYAQLQDRRLALWHLDGRVAVLGRGDKPYQFNAVPLAFAAYQTPLPEPVVLPPPVRTRESLDDFVIEDKPLPLATLDASVYNSYAEILWTQSAFAQHQAQQAHLALGVPVAVLNLPALLVPDQALAANLLAQRAARQAMAANPDHPLAYLILAECLANNANWMPSSHSNDFELQRITALRRYLERMPLAADLPVIEQSRPVNAALESLAKFYETYKMEDALLEVALRHLETQKRLLPLENRLTPDQVKTVSGNIDRHRTRALERSQQLQIENPSAAPPMERVRLAHERRRPEEMRRILLSEPFKNDTSQEAVDAELVGIELCLNAGMLESMLPLLEPLRAKITRSSLDPGYYKAVHAKARRIAGSLPAIREKMEADKAEIRTLTLPLREFVKTAIRTPQDFALRMSGTLDGALGGTPALIISQLTAQAILQIWREHSNSELRLGVLSLLEGKPTEAQAHFEAALVPQGIPLPTGDTGRNIAERYLRLIKSADQGSN